MGNGTVRRRRTGLLDNPLFRAVREAPGTVLGETRPRRVAPAGPPGDQGDQGETNFQRGRQLAGEQRQYEGERTKYVTRKRMESETAAREESAKDSINRAAAAMAARELAAGGKVDAAMYATFRRIAGEKPSAADGVIQRRQRIADTLAQSRVNNARYDASTAQRMAATGAVPRAIIQAPGGPAREFTGDETHVGTYAQGAQMPASAYGQMAGLRADVAQQYGPGGMDIYRAYGAPGAQGVQDQQLAMRPGTPGPQLTPGQYQHVQDRMGGYRVAPGMAETRVGGQTAMPEQDVAFLSALQQRAGDWGSRWRMIGQGQAELGSPAWQTKVGQQQQLISELAAIFPDPRERAMYLSYSGLSPQLAGVPPVAIQPGVSGMTGTRPVQVPGYNEAITATTGGQPATFATPQQEQAAAEQRIKDAQAALLASAGVGGPGANWSVQGTQDPEKAGRITGQDLTNQLRQMALDERKELGSPISEVDVAQAQQVPAIVGLESPERGFTEAFGSWANRMEGIATRADTAIRNITNPRARRSAALTLMASPQWAAFKKYAQQGALPPERIIALHKPPARLSPLGVLTPGGWVGAQDAENAPRAVIAVKRLVDFVEAMARPTVAAPTTQPTTQPAGR